MNGDRIRVIVADDSTFVRRLLVSYLESEAGMEVVGAAADGAELVELVAKLRPDAVTLDLDMPGMSGLEALQRIMRDCPIPVLVISGTSRRAAEATRQALTAGAVDFILKFTPNEQTDPEALRAEIVTKVRAAARVRILSGVRAVSSRPGSRATSPSRPFVPANSNEVLASPQVVIIGASTGGPLALRQLLVELPDDFPAAVVIVQHMPPAFTSLLADQLSWHLSRPVKEARDGEVLDVGTWLVAPGEMHLLFSSSSQILLKSGPKVGGHCPSIDVAMQSAARTFGARTHGIVLTGMGDDGALGLLDIRSHGGTTYAQNSASCVVSGMPDRAVDTEVVDHIGTPAEIARLLTQRVLQIEALARQRRIGG